MTRTTEHLKNYYKKVYQQMPTASDIYHFNNEYVAKTIYLLSGKMGVGKDTFGEMLERHIGSRRLAFADKLKMTASDYSGIPVSFFHSQEGKKMIIRPHPSRMTKIWHRLKVMFKTCSLDPESEASSAGVYLLDCSLFNKIKSDLDSYFKIIAQAKQRYTLRDILIMVGQTELEKDPYAWISPVYNQITAEENKGVRFFHITDCRSRLEIEALSLWLSDIGHTVVTVRLERDEVQSASTHITEIELDNYTFDIVLKNKTLDELEKIAAVNL